LAQLRRYGGAQKAQSNVLWPTSLWVTGNTRLGEYLEAAQDIARVGNAPVLSGRLRNLLLAAAALQG